MATGTALSKNLPSGVVTFLFTDIEGSTSLWECHPEQMRSALAQHDALLHEIVEHNDGVIFKTVGDACCCAFASPANALTAAVEAQRTIHANEWPSELGAIRVRMGIHTGDATLRDGDYFGTSVNRVARLASIAYGEQVLVSQATAGLVRDSVSKEIGLRELGVSRLRGLTRPEPTFQVIAEGLRADFPPLAALASRPNNLPAQLSSFVGRRIELDALHEILARSRLLTITGPGGIGKTRIALHLAAEVIDRYPDGVWFVDLTAVQNPHFVTQTIASNVGVHEVSKEPIGVTLVAHFMPKRALLLIDNAEQVLSEVARIVRSILTQCALMTIATTSREPLHLPGEQIYRLGSLTGDAPQLFLERARQAAPALTLGDAEREEIVNLCQKLEGIPLAIELACARLSAMPLTQLASRLTSGLNLRSKDSTENLRHRALRETISWSYELLSASEKTVLADLSVFRGSCTAEAISAVAGDVAGLEDVVESLVDKSLLQTEERAGEMRYRLLDIVREFAREQLDDESRENTARLHATYYVSRAEKIHDQRDAPIAYSQLDNEVTNLRAAIEWCIAHNASSALQLVRSLAPYWRNRGLLTEARMWTSRVADVIGGTGAERAEVLCLAASFATLQDDLSESLRLSQEALELYRDSNNQAGIASARFRIAEAVHRQGHLDRAGTLYRQALSEFRATNDARGEMLCVGNLGMLARQNGDLVTAAKLLEESRRAADALGEERIAGECTMAMGWVQLGLGRLAEARRLFDAVFDQKSAADDRYGVCCARHGRATVALKEGRRDEALQEFLGTLELANELQLKDYVARALHGTAAIKAQQGDLDRAAHLLGLADRLFGESGRELHDSVAYDMAADLLDAAMPLPQRQKLRAEGSRMRVADVLAALR